MRPIQPESFPAKAKLPTIIQPNKFWKLARKPVIQREKRKRTPV